MVAYPASLPRLPLLGWTEKAPKNMLRSQMEYGPDKVRRRTTSGPREIQWPLKITEAQATVLMDFFEVTLYSGTVEFTHIHPRTLAACTYRFRSEPEITHTGRNQYSVTLELEILA